MTEKIIKDFLIAEGKTKKIFGIKNYPLFVISEYKNAITAFDDPVFTKEFNLKAEFSNETTCNVFEFFKNNKIPTAFIRKLDNISFLAYFTKMIPLEVVVRRYAVGKYLLRYPEYKTEKDEPPYRLNELVLEFFLKTTNGSLKNASGETIVSGLDYKQKEEDPLIINPRENKWKLFNPTIPNEQKEADLNKTVLAQKIFPVNKNLILTTMSNIALKTFSLLEEALDKIGEYKLIDFKLEFGINPYGAICISDCLDNDSWRLKNKNWKELSKESFRQGEELSIVEKRYGFVSEISKKLLNL